MSSGPKEFIPNMLYLSVKWIILIEDQVSLNKLFINTNHIKKPGALGETWVGCGGQLGC
jgi:hypothetical protein